MCRLMNHTWGGIELFGGSGDYQAFERVLSGGEAWGLG